MQNDTFDRYLYMYVHVIYFVKNFRRHALVQSTYSRLPACMYEYGVCLCVYRQESALPRQHGFVAAGLRVRRQHDRGKENVSACVLSCTDC